MTNDQIAIGVLTGLLVAKSLFTTWLFIRLKQANSNAFQLGKRVIELRNQLSQQEIIGSAITQIALSNKNMSLDKKTTSLIQMAIGNKNENESRNAATEACKRIAKQLGIS
jgi:hypothetical protein